MGRQSKFEHHKEAILRAIDSLTRKEGKPPSMRQISAETGVRVATLHSYLKKLKTQDLIEMLDGKHRSLRLKHGALAATGQGAAPPSPPAPTSPPSIPTNQPVAAVPAYSSRVQVDDTVDVGF